MLHVKRPVKRAKSLGATPEQSKHWRIRSRWGGKSFKGECNEGLPKVHHVGEGDDVVALKFFIIHAPTGQKLRATVLLDSFFNSTGTWLKDWGVMQDNGAIWCIPQSEVAAWASVDD